MCVFVGFFLGGGLLYERLRDSENDDGASVKHFLNNNNNK